MRLFRFLVVLVLIATGAAVGAAWWEDRNFVEPGPATTETNFMVEQGSSLRAIADRLAQSGVVKSALMFRIGLMRRGKAAQLKAGEYSFPAHASEAQVMDMLVTHMTIEHRITIAEGLTSDAAASLVAADPILTGPVPIVPEGSLLPETYLFERGTTRAEILARMHKEQEALIAQLWPNRKEGLPFETPQEALNLASIVEKETALPAERPRIAAVFVNRLKTGMRLESDPTIIYGLTKGVPLGHPLRQSELAMPNPFSTYQITGLPPTPICNPGREAIAAVLNPPDTDELFFVANGTGGHAFAKSIAEHQRNVAQWRRLQRTPAPASGARVQPTRLR